ncbi:hypothetical protein CCHL11_09824 [Colletotrichum chlorophyti]|uniref:Uncharacterized protein n=1 Tax=Colletotrichum chlorophyti TaxID=708187 RepID=A0A1Q8RAR1_9PEZI|nr:hypothetical protein CCHL11_09824 [Colletotrichum chlorophyti]
MKNPFKPRKAPAQTWSGRSAVLAADDPVFKDYDECEASSPSTSSQNSQQQQQQQNATLDAQKHEARRHAAAGGTDPPDSDTSSNGSLGEGMDYGAIAGSFASDHSGGYGV